MVDVVFDALYYTAKFANFQALPRKKTLNNEVFSRIVLYKIPILGYHIGTIFRKKDETT